MLKCGVTPLCAVLVRQIDDLLDAALDDHLGALVAREQRHVDGAAGHVLRVLVEDGVHLRVAHVHIFVLQSDKYPPVKPGQIQYQLNLLFPTVVSPRQ